MVAAEGHPREDAMPPSHAAGPTEPPLLDETIGAALRRVAAEHGGREALVARHQGIRLSYAELDAETDRLARALLALGVEQGDRIGIWAPNCAEWVLTQFATARIGAVLVNVNPAYRTTELRYALGQSGCRALIAARAFKSSDYVAMVAEVRPELPALTDVVWLGGAGVGRAARARRRGRRGRAGGARGRASHPATRSTSSTRAARPAPRRARRSRTATSSTTATSSAPRAATDRRTASASRSPSTTASAWSWATSAR